MLRGSFARYITILLAVGVGVFFVLEFGTRVHPKRAAQATVSAPSADAQPTHTRSADTGGVATFLRENLRHGVGLLLLQVLVILGASKVVGSILHRLGQPSVIGEMFAGILLGPSLLGAVSPATMAYLFPQHSLDYLKMLSQIGVIIYMFVVGMELSIRHIRQKSHAAVLVSHASIVIPFFLGSCLSLLIYSTYAPANIDFIPFALFMSVAMSITAFPVLARIIQERGISKTQLGSMALACAAIDDVTAWCLLAVVTTIVKAAGLASAALTILLTLIFIAAMLFLLGPYFARLADEHDEQQPHSRGLVTFVLLFVFASALFTEVIGIHALFGAFLAGIIMPVRSGLRTFLASRLEHFTSALLLPLFFALTGLRTQIGLLDDWSSWAVCAGVVATAVAGKLGGSMLAARWAGMNWSESLSLGVLMNTRGLIELIVLNIGYDLGVLSDRIFSIMVIMALVTTFMAGPLLTLIESWRKGRTTIPEEVGVVS